MRRIEIMRNDPVVLLDGVETKIEGRQRELFRLLVLYAGKTVSKDSIAQLRDTNSDTAASKIRYLRAQLVGSGCNVALDRANGYRANLAGWSVDAEEFRTAVELVVGHGHETSLTHPIAEDLARQEVEKLSAALALWGGNPAVGLPVEEGLEQKFEALKTKAEDRLLMARLYTRQHHEVREAIQQLEFRVRKKTADDLVWKLLLIAYDAIGGSSQVASTWEKIVDHYSQKVPSDLRQVMTSINQGTEFTNPFRDPHEPPNRSQGAPDLAVKPNRDAEGTLPALCDMLGITTTSRLRLLDSHLTPTACIRRTRTRLYFSGVLASKWVIDPAVRSEFDQLLGRLDANQGESRFLMINPKGDGYGRLCGLRKGNISLESVAPLKKLAEEHPSLQVRAYNNLPSFRIVIIDDDVVSFSPYRLAADAYLATDRGWEAPHVVLDPIAKYPLAEAFLLLFEETWNSSIPIGEI